MTTNFILSENTLNDNTLSIANKGYIFKGGYVAVLREYTYLNSWNDKENILKFRSKKRLLKYLDKKYSEDVICELDFTDTVLSE